MQKRVLLVDNNFDDLFLMKSVLEKEGYEVSTAANSPQLSSALAKAVFDLVFLDIHLQAVSGYDVMHLLGLRSKNKTPVILISSSSKGADHVAWADGFIQKPFTAETLLKEVGRVLKPAGEPDTEVKKKRVLLVDDEPDTQDAIRRALHGADYTVITANDGRECLEKYSKLKPDLVLIDLMIKGNSMSDVVRQISDTKVAYLSAMRISESERNELFTQKNVVDFIQKPFDIDEFTKRVTKII